MVGDGSGMIFGKRCVGVWIYAEIPINENNDYNSMTAVSQ